MNASVGTHPYFAFQSSMICLVSRGGNVFYSSLLQYMRTYEAVHPGVVPAVSKLTARDSITMVTTSTFRPFIFPPELMEHIFRYVDHEYLLVARTVSQAWCLSASHFTHSRIVFRLGENWQGVLEDGDRHQHEAEAYALVAGLAFTCAAARWQFMGWVHTFVSENWPELRVPFFFRVFNNVRMVAIRGRFSSVQNFPIIPSTYILPKCVWSLYLFQCSLHRHSLESLIALCSDLEFLSIVGVHYGHIVSAIHLPTGCLEVANRLIKVVRPPSSLPIAIDSWRHTSGITSFIADAVSSPPPPALKDLHVDFPDSLLHIFSPESDVEGTPPLLNQLFVPAGMPSCVKSFLCGAEVYPVWL